MWVKICAHTNLQDALLSAAYGADALGFVFAPSKRRVTAEQVAAITPHLPPAVERVGIFAGHSAEEIAQAAASAGLNAVQLHDGFNAALTDNLLLRLGLTANIIQTVLWKVGDPGQAEEVTRRLDQILAHSETLPRVLVDAKVGAGSGGLGISFDWSEAQPVFAAFASRARLILAGGLHPDNVKDAIRTLKPWGVDVASGVEAQPGSKDSEKLQKFLQGARQT